MSDKSIEKTSVIPALSLVSTPPPAPAPVTKDKTYTIVTKDKTVTAKAQSVAWTENCQFILLMDGEVTKHVIVAANVLAVTED
jgi:hypothetical protein